MSTKRRITSYFMLLIIISVVIISKSTTSQNTVITPQVMNEYMAEKGTGASISFGSFGEIVNSIGKKIEENILGAKTEIEEEEEQIKPNKSVTGNLTIAVLGDSMIHTLGPEVSTLKPELEKLFPKAKFSNRI